MLLVRPPESISLPLLFLGGAVDCQMRSCQMRSCQMPNLPNLSEVIDG